MDHIRSRDEENNILWKYVTKIGKLGDGGGNCKWVCNFCHQEKQGSYTRVRVHLLNIKKQGIAGCTSVGKDDISEMKKMMFYTGGIPFNLANNPYFLSSFVFAANHSLGGYVPPSFNKLRTTLLQQEKAHVERLLEPIKSTWFEKSVSIVSDGWSDPRRRPLINIMVFSESGPMFVKAVDCSGEIKDKQFIAKLLKEVIHEVGHEKVVQVITDNARNCKAAGEIIEGMFPNIYWTPCIVYTLNLALKNICAARNAEANQVTYDLCSWISIVHADAMQIKNFIMNHNMRLAIFYRFSHLKLLSVADTRFASVVVILKRFKLIKCALGLMVFSEQWAQYREDDQGKARFVRDTVVNEDWWKKVDYILSFTAPIYEMLRNCDTDKPCLHLAYEMWDSMIEKVKKTIYENEGKQRIESSAFYDVVHEILVDRWAKYNTPLHCLAHSLNPKYYSDKWLRDGEGRLPPHMDGEVSTERIKCFKRMFANEEDRAKVNDEFANFSLKLESGGHAMVQLLLCFNDWHLGFLDNLLPPLVVKGIGTKMWDVGGDEFGSMEDTGILEIADLSLDEPELETVLFTEDEAAEK
ncbi:PREDICTED: uncharacterized protein LOC105973898 [Erythranthe guttata]|uniref:uncharacterized protein LOC105973898 n=1 Tax=Erythranthe guttata TaxID=4155 RepID=UPI00064E0AD4|nr:PREDICTED: uncharacterized protein LOC105973898 [Erythranthe guttata]|eukprot:XP_012854393.1 PREDICTED: uncharacterized protein LOC105973898 [Erythranthe guttata]